jgi:hypothetical protein
MKDLEPELFTCFDRNMEKRLFHNQERAEQVAVGPVTGYVSIETMQKLLAEAMQQKLTSDQINKELKHIDTNELALSAGRRDSGGLWIFDTLGLSIFVDQLMRKAFAPFITTDEPKPVSERKFYDWFSNALRNGMMSKCDANVAEMAWDAALRKEPTE